jgi:hypothetical protein
MGSAMFFRRMKPKPLTFDDRLAALDQAGFAVERPKPGQAVAAGGRFAAAFLDSPQGQPRIEQAGMAVPGGIATLVNRGYQMFWKSPGGRLRPALAEELKEFHRFQEDLKEALGLISLYNTALGTTTESHAYDRVEMRDEGVPARPWDRARGAAGVSRNQE